MYEVKICDTFNLWKIFSLFLLIVEYNHSMVGYSPKEISLKNSKRGPFGFECLSFTFCYLDFILTPYDPCHLLWWVDGWGVFLLRST